MPRQIMSKPVNYFRHFMIECSFFYTIISRFLNYTKFKQLCFVCLRRNAWLARRFIEINLHLHSGLFTNFTDEQILRFFV